MRKRLPTPALGERFGRLTVVKTGETHNQESAAICVCDCGATRKVKVGHLRSGNTRSCGCRQRDAARRNLQGVQLTSEQRSQVATRHGYYATPTWHSWMAMLNRVRGKSNKSDRRLYAHVSVHPGWDPQQGGSFEQFLADVGERLPDTTLDRYPEREGDYVPGNVRWALPLQQQNNKRNNHRLSFNDRTMTVTEWSRETGIATSTILNRLKRGWSAEDAVTKPPRGKAPD